VSNFFRLLFNIYEQKIFMNFISFPYHNVDQKLREKNNFFNLIPPDISIILFYAHEELSKLNKHEILIAAFLF